MRILAAVEQREVFEYLFLQGHEHSGNQFLIRNGVGFQTVGHYVVDVLDEDDVCVQVVQVLNQRAMTTGRKQQFAVVSGTGWLTISAAMVSVLGFCSEKVM